MHYNAIAFTGDLVNWIDVDERIVRVTDYHVDMSNENDLLTHVLVYHEYIVLTTENSHSRQSYWSLEKDTVGIKLQRAVDLKTVRDNAFKIIPSKKAPAHHLEGEKRIPRKSDTFGQVKLFLILGKISTRN